ncbi:MAG TPA: MTH1187 family thiamine-binding protein [Thermoplasmatales archaeon]|nr:MTH1187 family thiamine-binding protein [Thermoplasmatales archaeon]
MIIAQISVSPVGVGTDLHEYVKAAVEDIKKSGVKFEVNAMATVVEVPDLSTLFEVVGRAHNAVLRLGAKRVITELKIDDRRDKEASVESKVAAVKV